MSLTDETYEEIRKYLDGELDAKAIEAFEQKLQSSKELATTTRIFQEQHDYLGEGKWPDAGIEGDHPKVQAYIKEFLSDDLKALSETLEEAGRKHLRQSDESSDGNVVFRLKAFRAAAAIVVLVGCLWFFMRPTSTDKLYADHVVHDEIILSKRGDNEEAAAKAEELFNNGEYSKAIPLLTELNGQGLNYDILLALGISHLEEGNYDKALLQFEEIYQSDAIIKDKALWYKSATYLKQGDKEKAIEILKQLQEDYPHYRTESARSILKRLK